MKPVPPVDPSTRGFWEACANGILQVQACGQCGSLQFYPRVVCTHCGGRDLELVPVGGRGAIKTFTIIRRPVSEAFAADVPYVVALVELAEGPTLMSNIVGCDPETVHIGQAVRVVFESRGDVSLPQFTPGN